MTTYTTIPWPPENPKRVGGRFVRLGWLGLLIQLVVLLASIGLVAYVLYFHGAEPVAIEGIEPRNTFAGAGLAVIVVSMLWLMRYIGLGRRLSIPDRCPTRGAVARALWLGMWISALAVICCVALLANDVGRMLLILFEMQAEADPTTMVTVIDGVALGALVVILALEVLFAIITLRLVFASIRPRGRLLEVALAAPPTPTPEPQAEAKAA